jgi:excisionase family DNA binding protein
MSGLTPANPHQSTQRRSRARRPSPEPRWATMKEAVEYSRIPWRTLRRWIGEGRLPGYRIGPRLIQVDLNDLDRLRRRLNPDAFLADADRQAAAEQSGAGT